MVVAMVVARGWGFEYLLSSKLTLASDIDSCEGVVAFCEVTIRRKFDCSLISEFS